MAAKVNNLGRKATGSIERRGECQWRATVSINKKRIRQTFDSLSAARDWIAAMLDANDWDQLKQIEAARALTLEDALIARLNRLKPKTREGQASPTGRLIREFQWLVSRRLYEINEVHILRFIKERTGIDPETSPADQKPLVGNAAVNNDLSIICATFNFARAKLKCIKLDNPIGPGVRLSKPKGRERRLDAKEEAALMRAATLHEQNSSIRVAAMIKFLIGTAMRAGELANMDWKRVNFRLGTALLIDTKNGTQRTVPLAPSIQRILHDLGPKESGTVWGEPEALRSAWESVRGKAAAQARADGDEELAVSIENYRRHDLRHEGVSRLVEGTTLNIAEIAVISGHKTLKMLAAYTHLRTHLLVSKLAAAEGESVAVVPFNPEGRTTPSVLGPMDLALIERRARWQMLIKSHVLMRAAVWERPMTAIAGEMGVTEAGVRKAAGRLGVEGPPTGYWLRKDRAMPAGLQRTDTA